MYVVMKLNLELCQKLVFTVCIRATRAIICPSKGSFSCESAATSNYCSLLQQNRKIYN